MKFTAGELVQGATKLIPWGAAISFSAFATSLAWALAFPSPGEDFRVAVWNGFGFLLGHSALFGLSLATIGQSTEMLGRRPRRVLASDVPFIAGLLIGWPTFAILQRADHGLFWWLTVPAAVILGPGFLFVLWWSGLFKAFPRSSSSP